MIAKSKTHDLIKFGGYGQCLSKIEQLISITEPHHVHAGPSHSEVANFHRLTVHHMNEVFAMPMMLGILMKLNIKFI